MDIYITLQRTADIIMANAYHDTGSIEVLLLPNAYDPQVVNVEVLFPRRDSMEIGENFSHADIQRAMPYLPGTDRLGKMLDYIFREADFPWRYTS